MKPAWRSSVGFDQAPTRAESGKSSSPHYWAPWMFLEVSAPSASDVTEDAVGEPWGIWGQHLLQAVVSFTGGFALSPSKGTGQLSRACSCHGFPGPALAPSLTMRHFIRGSTTPFGNQVLFHLPQLLHH